MPALAFCLPGTMSAWEQMAPRVKPRPVQLHNFWNQQVPYEQALRWQRLLHAECVEALRTGNGQPRDTLILLQHPPVLTLGRSR